MKYLMGFFRNDDKVAELIAAAFGNRDYMVAMNVSSNQEIACDSITTELHRVSGEAIV